MVLDSLVMASGMSAGFILAPATVLQDQRFEIWSDRTTHRSLNPDYSLAGCASEGSFLRFSGNRTSRFRVELKFQFFYYGLTLDQSISSVNSRRMCEESRFSQTKNLDQAKTCLVQV